MNNFAYKILRSRRRTLVITVIEGQILVKAPYSVSEEAICKFINGKEAWIAAKIEEQNSAAAHFAGVKEGRSLLDVGIERPVLYGADKNHEIDAVFYLKNQNSVRRYFEATRGWLLYECLHSFSIQMRVSPKEVSLCDFKARWGSCDAEGHIKLNWRLTMLPAELRDYVIVHELSHLRELNHSPAFWKVVSRYCPAYRGYRKELRDYSFLTQLYGKKSG